MVDFTYYNPVKMFCGKDQIHSVIEEIRKYGKKVLLILGGESFMKNGNYQALTSALDAAGLERYEIKGNRVPSLAVVRKGIALCRGQEISCVLGIGGGVCMDIAKTIAFGVKQQGDIWDYLTGSRQPDTQEHLPVGTIPTFPSSGSDMNGSTQITNDETAEQAGLSGVYPNFAWLNPEYISSLSVEALVQGQLTTFVQVSIAYLGLERSEVAEQMALTFLDLIRSGLRKLMAEPENQSVRTDLMIVSALNVSGLTNLGKNGDWSLYPLEGIIQNYYGVGYKHAITVLFPYWLKQCYGGQQIFKDYFAQVFDIECTGKSDEQVLSEGMQAIFDLYQEFGFPVSFSQIKDSEENLDELRDAIRRVGEQPSIYTTFTAEKTEAMLCEAIKGA